MNGGIVKVLSNRLGTMSAVIAIVLLLSGTAPAAETAAKMPGLSLTLEESVQKALANNNSLEAERLALSVAESRLAQVRARRKAVVGAAGGATYGDPGGSLGDNIMLYNLSFQASRTIYDGGLLRAGEEQAQLGVDKARADYDAARDELVLSVKKAFYGLAKAQRQETVSREAVQLAEAQLDTARKFLKAGTVARYDVLRAETLTAQMRQNLLLSSNGVRLSEAALNDLLGVELDTPVTLKLDAAIKPVDSSLDGLIAAAWSRRPELQGLDIAARINALGGEAAKASLRPSLTAVAGYDVLRQDTYGSGNGRWSVNLSASLPLFDGGMTKARLAEVDDTGRQLELRREDLKRKISLQVRQAYLNVQAAYQRIEAAAQSVEQASEGNRIGLVRYQAGVSTSVELIDAQSALTQARTNYNNSVSDYETAVSELERAVAGPVDEEKK